jgi:hypothetical protein
VVRSGTPEPDTRRPWWVWAGSFAILAGVLCVRNAFLFTTRIYEMADMAANSILIEQARRFQLLVGNYSRLGFHHPGPAYMYVQAAGESLFYDLLHVVPTPWNGQVLAVYVLNAALLAMAVAVCHGWRRSPGTAFAALALLAGFAALHPAALSSDWMPYEYVVPYLVFTIAAASVAAGHGRDAWIMAFSGWLLVHGQATFLVFVPVITAAVLAVVAVRARRPWRISRGVWVPVAAISAVFALPILLELALHWPGYFADYLKYSSSKAAGGHNFHTALRYVLWFWWPRSFQIWLPFACYLVAGLAIWLLARGPARWFLAALLAVNVVSTVLLFWYAVNSIDHLTDTYVGYFYWAVPAATALVAALAAAWAIREAVSRTALAAAAAAFAVALFALAPLTKTSVRYADPSVPSSGYATDPRLPAAITLMTERSPRRPLVIHVGPDTTWPSATGLLVMAERRGVLGCIAGSFWEFMVTSEFICTNAQVRHGANYNLEPLVWRHPHAMIVLRGGWLVPRTGPMKPPAPASVTK